MFGPALLPCLLAYSVAHASLSGTACFARHPCFALACTCAGAAADCGRAARRGSGRGVCAAAGACAGRSALNELVLHVQLPANMSASLLAFGPFAKTTVSPISVRPAANGTPVACFVRPCPIVLTIPQRDDDLWEPLIALTLGDAQLTGGQGGRPRSAGCCAGLWRDRLPTHAPCVQAYLLQRHCTLPERAFWAASLPTCHSHQ